MRTEEGEFGEGVTEEMRFVVEFEMDGDGKHLDVWGSRRNIFSVTMTAENKVAIAKFTVEQHQIADICVLVMQRAGNGML